MDNVIKDIQAYRIVKNQQQDSIRKTPVKIMFYLAEDEAMNWKTELKILR